MLTSDVITDTVYEWLSSLDYEYMLLHIIVSYGIYYSPNMEWVKTKLNGTTYAIWKIGGILAAIEVARILPFLEPEGGAALVQKSVSIFHSYILIQVFVEDIVRSVNRWIQLLRKTN